LPERFAGLLNLVEQEKAQFEFICVAGRQRLLRKRRMRFPVPQTPCGRANQFGDLVRVLKFRAIHFDECPAISEANLCSGIDNVGLAGAGRPR
jgi:hypothetical protein